MTLLQAGTEKLPLRRAKENMKDGPIQVSTEEDLTGGELVMESKSEGKQLHTQLKRPDLGKNE